MGKINVAIIGIGNAAAGLLQGLYLVNEKGKDLEGLLHWNIGGYKPTDIEIVAAYDVDKRKVGKDLAEAIFTEPNNPTKITDVPKTGITVESGVLKDKLGILSSQVIEPVEKQQENIFDSLKSKNAEIIVNLISGFAINSSQYYAKQSAENKISFINCTPSLVAAHQEIANLFTEKGAVVVGDDLMSQIGSTAIHKVILELLKKRGAKISASYALDVGGSPEAFSSLELRSRRVKSKLKTESIRSEAEYEFPVLAMSMDYVDFLGDYRDAIIHITGKFFGDAEVTMEIKVRTPDSLNAFNPIIDVIRAVKVAMDRNISGPITSISAYYFKRPPKRMPLSAAEMAFKEFLEGKRND